MNVFSPVKTLFYFLLIVIFSSPVIAQSNQWTWLKGDNTVNNVGVYGVKGVSSATNNPGSRGGSVRWTDATGNLWLFGGELNESSSSFFNDLWRYDPSTNEWTWMKGDNTMNSSAVYGTMGIAAMSNTPGARTRAVSWTDATGNLWLFGGYGYDAYGLSSYLNDLWKYNISTNMWTWVKGGNGTGPATSGGIYGTRGTPSDNNNPGTRNMSVSWADAANNLWLLGGQGFDSKSNFGSLNDLWKYNTATNQWTWVNGDTIANVKGSYGNQSVVSITNKPGGRIKSVGWTDLTGDLWLFGGTGFANGGTLNDLWKYNISSNVWTWVNGDSTAGVKGVYGTKGTLAPANKPGARELSTGWSDQSGDLWLFGGIDYGTNTSLLYNDLWKYNASSNAWTWVSGDSTVNNVGDYGTRGTSSASNKPGGRFASVGWITQGSLWLFGGEGYASSSTGSLNDLWKFTPPQSTLPVTLISFTAKLQDQESRLEWIADNEQNLRSYEIERSINGIDYSPLQQLKATNAKHYNFNDDVKMFKGLKLYYRLKMINKDGSNAYSAIVILKIASGANFTVYPNPAGSQFQVKTDKNIRGKVDIRIADKNGKVLVTGTYNAAGTPITLSTNRLATGAYLVKIIYNNEQYLQTLIVVK